MIFVFFYNSQVRFLQLCMKKRLMLPKVWNKEVLVIFVIRYGSFPCPQEKYYSPANSALLFKMTKCRFWWQCNEKKLP